MAPAQRRLPRPKSTPTREWSASPSPAKRAWNAARLTRIPLLASVAADHLTDIRSLNERTNFLCRAKACGKTAQPVRRRRCSCAPRHITRRPVHTANEISCALISIVAEAQCAYQRPGTLMQDRSPTNYRSLPATQHRLDDCLAFAAARYSF
jgi:hypothetical protein